MNEQTFKTIIEYGEHYRQTYLIANNPKEELTANWWQALTFLFSHIFYQGRRDTVSTLVVHRALAVLETELSKVGGELNRLNLNALADELHQVIGKGKVGKGGDVLMTLGVIEFIRKLPDFNIVSYSIRRIRAGDTDRHYHELDELYQIGPKVSSFYLRDVVLLFGLEDCVSEEFQFSLQPIDTWVEQIAVRTGLVSDGTTHENIRRAIIAACKELGGSPLKFNAGAWFVGSHQVAI